MVTTVTTTQGRIDALLKREYGLTDQQLAPEAKLDDDLGIDSIDSRQLAMDLEDLFRIKISDLELEATKTYGQLLALVEGKI